VDVISLGYRTDLMVRALEGSEVIDHAGHITVRTAANPDFRWGNFLLLPAAALPGGASQCLALFAAEFPAAAHVLLGIDSTRDDPAHLAGFEAAGLRVRRETVMTATAPAGPPHPGRDAQIRQLTSDGDWEQSAELRALCNAEDGVRASRAFAEARITAQRGLASAGHGAWFGAFQNGKLAAHLGVFSDGSGIARYQDVGTHPRARRQGLAASLVCHAARYAIDQLAATTLVIVADPDGPAIRVYRSVGFADLQTLVSMHRLPVAARAAAAGPERKL
jgi:ribosomal protein S18 acetylase RimI-like enzyme